MKLFVEIAKNIKIVKIRWLRHKQEIKHLTEENQKENWSDYSEKMRETLTNKDQQNLKIDDMRQVYLDSLRNKIDNEEKETNFKRKLHCWTSQR